MEYRLKRNDGEYRWLLDNGVPIFDIQNTFIGYIGSCIDITDRINAEAELMRSNADLQRFAEITAHHLQEPARRIASYAERLKAQLTGELENAEAQLSLNYLDTNARHLKVMLGDIELYLAAAQPIGISSSMNVKELLRKKLLEMERRINDVHATVSLGQLPEVHLDSHRINTVFSIALDNALTHAQSIMPLKLTISGERVGSRVFYRISDNGVGIEEQYRERVFRVFERISAKASGSGIGLSILRRIAESTGGRAWIEETLGGGCTLIIDLPTGEH
jgi:light-regulated signal transduction histidine kinase (bacteriophytochrome)